MERYYQLLGLGSTCSNDDIRKAYRKLAMALHPDRNASPDAKQKFIEVTEAYKILMAYRTGGYTRIIRKAVNKRETKADFLRKQRARSRQKAMEYAEMKYAEFLKSEGYLTRGSLAVIVWHISFIACLSIIFVLPFVLSSFDGTRGLFMSVITILVTSPLTIFVLRDFHEFSLSNFRDAVNYLARRYVIFYILLGVINVLVILTIGFQTMLPTTMLLFAYPITSIITQLMQRTRKHTLIGSKYFKAICVSPTILSGLLVINFLFSFDPVFESYRFSAVPETVHSRYGTRTEPSTLIRLENDAYADYWGIRVFNDYTKVLSGSVIQYKFKTGLFGIKVMTDYGIKGGFQ